MRGITLVVGEVAVFLTLSALILAACLWGRHGVAGFLRRHSSIEDAASLSEFKALVRGQMWVAIGVMFLGFAFGIFCFLLTIQLLLTGMLLVLAVSAPLFILARSNKQLEKKARTLVCANGQLQLEYSKVAAAWTGSLFPNF